MTAKAVVLAGNSLAATWDIGNLRRLTEKRGDPNRALFPNYPGLAMFGRPHCDLFSDEIEPPLAAAIIRCAIRS
jgi:hypothetical protein